MYSDFMDALDTSKSAAQVDEAIPSDHNRSAGEF